MMRKRTLAVVAAMLIFFLSSLMSATAAQAQTSGYPDTYCLRKSVASVVKTYAGQYTTIPLRCGTPRWGFTHLVAAGRWSASFDSQIQLTLSQGEDNGHQAVLFDANCHEIFRVVYSQGPYNGANYQVNPMGIVTAYYSSTTYLALTPPRSAVATPPLSYYRTDCPIYDLIVYP